jgi:DNA-binding NtrC family response regulator
MLTINNQTENIIEATKNGAFYYLTKPLDPQKILVLSEKAIKMSISDKTGRNLHNKNKLLKKQLGYTKKACHHTLIGSSSRIQETKHILEKVIASGADLNIFLYGESGVGKEVFARYINQLTSETTGEERPFVAVNCTSIPGDLFESEFFGHEKGSFTGASKQKAGYFELADGGDIFLDEIGDMPLTFQTKLLRAIQEKQFRRVGGDSDITCDFNVISATNQDLKQKIKGGLFRQDLYYRLVNFEVTIPPLRDRVDDIPQLIKHFVQRLETQTQMRYNAIDDRIIDQLMLYDWPGNIRELKYVIERLVIISQGQDTYYLEDLPEEIRKQNSANKIRCANDSDSFELVDSHTLSDAFRTISHKQHIDIKTFIAGIEKNMFTKALEASKKNCNEAAKLLGLKRSTFYARMKSLDISL